MDKLSQLNQDYLVRAQELAKNGVTPQAISLYGREHFEKSRFPKVAGSDRAKHLTPNIEALLDGIEEEELFMISIGFEQISNIYAASPSTVVKQALARNCDIEMIEGYNGEFEQYRGAKMAITPHEKVVKITVNDNVSVIPVYHGAMNVNMVKLEDGDSALVMDQIITDILWVHTHLFTYTKGKFEMKSAWSLTERRRFGFDKIFKYNYIGGFTAINRHILKAIKMSKYAGDFKDVTLAGPKLAEKLEAVFSLQGITKEILECRKEVIDWYADIFQDARIPDAGRVKTIFKKTVEKQDQGKIVMQVYEMPLSHRSDMFPTTVNDVRFHAMKSKVTYLQAAHELKEARAKCGVNVSNELTPGTREMLMGVKTGTPLIDVLNLISNLGTIVWKDHLHVVLRLKAMGKASNVLRALGTVVDARVNFYVPMKFVDKSLVGHDENGFYLVSNDKVRLNNFSDMYNLSMQHPNHKFTEINLEGNGDEVLGKVEEATRNGKLELENIRVRGMPCVTRLTYYPGLFSEQGFVVYSGTDLHNMVVWVTYNMSLNKAKMADRYSSLLVDEPEYYRAVTLVNIMRQVNPFWQRDVRAQLVKFNIKVPVLATKLRGITCKVDLSGPELFDTEDYTRYTNTTYRALAIQDSVKRHVADKVASQMAERDDNRNNSNSVNEEEENNVQEEEPEEDTMELIG